jgi:cytochrome P450
MWQAYVMILAGYETTANALAFALYLLAANKAAEARVAAEVDAFGRDRTPAYDDIEGCAARAGRVRVT